MTKNVRDQKWRETRQCKYDKTVKTTTLIQAQRHKVVEKWECHFRNEIRRNNKLKTFFDSRKPPTPQRSVTENEIFEDVASGRLFGIVECVIRVPDKWPSYFQHPPMTRTNTSKRCHLCSAPPTYRSTSSANTCKITSNVSNYRKNLDDCW
jgi:hypothetical protein